MNSKVRWRLRLDVEHVAVHPSEGRFAVLAKTGGSKCASQTQVLAEFDAGHPQPASVHNVSAGAMLVAATYLPQGGGGARLCVVDSNLAFSSAFNDEEEDGDDPAGDAGDANTVRSLAQRRPWWQCVWQCVHVCACACVCGCVHLCALVQPLESYARELAVVWVWVSLVCIVLL